MKLPNKFQMRLKEYPGFTHVVTVTLNHDYKCNSEYLSVKWARGFAEKLNIVPNKLVHNENAKTLIAQGTWLIVDEKAKQKKQEGCLPDFFRCTYAGREQPYNAEVINNKVYVWLDGWPTKAEYKIQYFKALIGKGGFQILDKKPLTAEQQRENKRIREEIAALEQSVKLNQQNIEHYTKLCANYLERIAQLEEKIVEEVE